VRGTDAEAVHVESPELVAGRSHEARVKARFEVALDPEDVGVEQLAVREAQDRVSG